MSLGIYIRLSCDVLTDDKVAEAGPAAAMLWIKGLLYAKRHLTGGVVPRGAATIISAGIGDTKRLAAKLVEVGLWVECDRGWALPEGKWERYQTSAEDDAASRKAAAERAKKYRSRRKNDKNPDENEDRHATVTRDAGVTSRARGVTRHAPSRLHSESENHSENQNHPKDTYATCPEAAEPPSGPEPEPTEFTAECVGTGPKTWTLMQPDLDALLAAYPTLDVRAEIRKSLVWIRASPANRKTAGGMLKFLTGWLNRATNAGGNRDSRNDRQRLLVPGPGQRGFDAIADEPRGGRVVRG